MKRRTFAYFALVFVLVVFVAELALYSFAPKHIGLLEIYPFFNTGSIDYFVDLQVVTLNGYGCGFPVESIYEASCYFNPTNIPRLFIHIARFLHIGAQNTRAVGFGVGSVSIGLLFLVYRYSLSRVQAIFAAVLVVGGFPYRLALERGNVDLVVLSLLLLSAFFLSLPSSKQRLQSILCACTSIACAAISVLGKVYPVLIFPVIVLVIMASHSFSRIVKIILVSLATALLIGSLVSLLPDLSHMTGSSYRELAGGLGYGLMTSPDKNVGELFTVLIKVFIVGFVVIFAVLDDDDFFGSRDSAKELMFLFRSSPRQRLISIAFFFGSLLFLGTYLVFVNGIYRLSVSFSLLAPWLVYWAFTRSKKIMSLSQGGLCLILSFLAISIVGYRPYRPSQTCSI